jgi:exosome complex exonuclease RRP6
MFFYARADTHFLLYIFDHMRNELIDRTNADIPEENRIEQVLQKSKETSLLRYERTVYNAESGRGPGGWYSLLVKTPALFNNEQFAVFRAVHEWRDKVARADDDSPSFVMPQHVIFSIAKLMPIDIVALLGIAHPVSHSVKSRAGNLLAVIKSAKARGKSGPSIIDVLRPDSVGAVVKTNLPVVANNTAPKTLVAVVDESQLRSESSIFWGGAFGSSLWDGPTLTHNETLRLAVPLPALSLEIFASSDGLANRSVVDREAPSEPKGSWNQPQKEEEAFVIRRGAKRKSDVISDEEEADQKKSKSSNGYQISVEDIAAARAGREIAAQKGARKAEKRAKKAAKKAAAAAAAETGGSESADVNDNDDDEDEEPFDYSKADSILHSKGHDGGKGGKKKEKPFDPYRKSEDASQGMRRLQTERAGKSHTFKS